VRTPEEVKEEYGTTNLREIAQKLFPHLSVVEIDFILTEKTHFPVDNKKALKQIEMLAGEGTCTWTLIDEDYNAYECSACEGAWCMGHWTPKENNYNYCPKCGRKITEVGE
jgi:DNA-directed RNA polymerase subunit RPC12/RpoP